METVQAARRRGFRPRAHECKRRMCLPSGWGLCFQGTCSLGFEALDQYRRSHGAWDGLMPRCQLSCAGLASLTTALQGSLWARGLLLLAKAGRPPSGAGGRSRACPRPGTGYPSSPPGDFWAFSELPLSVILLPESPFYFPSKNPTYCPHILGGIWEQKTFQEHELPPLPSWQGWEGHDR